MKLPEDIAREVRLREEAERLRGELANSEAERMRLAEKLEKANVLIARCDLAMTVGSMSVSEAIERCREVLPKEKHDDDISVAVGRTIEFLRGQINEAREEACRNYADAVRLDRKNTQIILALASIAEDNGVEAIEAKAKRCVVECDIETCGEIAEHKCMAHDCLIALCAGCADKHGYATYHDTSPMRDTVTSEALALCRIVRKHEEIIAAIISGRDVTAEASGALHADGSGPTQELDKARETTATLVAAVREFRAAEAACNEAQREFHEANKAYRNLHRESFHPASINDGLRACNEAQSVLDEAQRRMRSASIVLDALTGEGRPGEKPTSEGGQRR